MRPRRGVEPVVLFSLDALHEDAEAQVIDEAGDGYHDGGVTGNKGLVDLGGVDGEALELEVGDTIDPHAFGFGHIEDVEEPISRCNVESKAFPATQHHVDSPVPG